MGGMGIFRVGPDGLNLGSIIETLNRDGTQTVMVQRYLTEIVARRQAHPRDRRRSRCRIALARIPQGSEIRGNLAVGGKGVAQPLIGARPRDRRGASARCWPRAACCWSASTSSATA